MMLDKSRSAAELGISVKFLDKLIRSNKIPAYKFGLLRGSLIPLDDMRRYCYRRRISGKYHHVSLYTLDFDDAYERALEKEKLSDIEFIRSLRSVPSMEGLLLTFNEAYSQFRSHRLKAPKSTTQSNDSRYSVLEKKIGHLYVESMTTNIIESTLKAIQKERAVKIATINRYRDLISAVLAQCLPV